MIETRSEPGLTISASPSEAGLKRKKPVVRRHPRQVPPEVVEQIVYLRQTYQMGPQRIDWYLERYHGAKVSCASVYRTLRRPGLSRLPKNAGRRAVHTHRYAKEVPGHHVQVDVKDLTLKAQSGKTVRRFQYTAIDDATRIRVLKIYQRHTQINAGVSSIMCWRSFPSGSRRLEQTAATRGAATAVPRPSTRCCIFPSVKTSISLSTVFSMP